MATRPKLPTVPAKTNDQEPQDQEQTSAAERLQAARALLAENQDAEQKSRLPEGGGDMFSTATAFVPAEAANLPPAAQGQIAAQAGAMASMLRAHEVQARMRNPGVVNQNTQGQADTIGGVVDAEDGMIVCPNCGGSWEYQFRYAGSTIPCGRCHFLIEVPYPDAMRAAVPDAESVEELRENVPPVAPGQELTDAALEAAKDDQKNDEGGETTSTAPTQD